MNLSIVIVTFNSAAQIGACLDSIASTVPLLEHEIIVVDNGSTDGTIATIGRHRPRVRLIESGGNAGFARGCNIGIRQSSGNLILLLNPDAMLRPDSIARLTRVLASRPEVAIVGPRLVDARGRAELSFGSMSGPWTEMRQKVLVRGHDRGTAIVSGYVERLTRSTREVDWVSGACLLVRHADALGAGLLDERYFMYLEDVDFCAAVRARGRRVLFVAEAEVMHLRGRSVASRPGPTEIAYRRSQIAFYAKHRPRWLPFLRAYLKVRGRLPEYDGVNAGRD